MLDIAETFATPGQLLWQDNSVLDFVNWGEAEPLEEQHENEYCVQLSASSGSWNSIPCSSRKGFICKTPKSKWLIQYTLLMFMVFY